MIVVLYLDMPFTFSHPAAVLPLNYLPKKWISISALVIGSMTPDFEYFIRMRVASQYSHNWKGLFWFDLPLGLILMLIYEYIVEDKLIDHLPGYFNRRFSAYKSPMGKVFRYNFIIVIICLLAGAASHLLWDSFTHPTGYFVLHNYYLRHKIIIGHYPVTVYNILQHLSSIAGALIILYGISRLPAGSKTNDIRAIYYWLKILAIGLVVLAIRIAAGLSIKQYGDVIVTAISGALIGLVLVSAITPKRQIATGD